MSENGNSDNSVSKLLAFVISSLKEHEEKIDQITVKLEKVKSSFSDCTSRLDSRMEKILGKISEAEEKMEKAKQIARESNSNWK